MYHHLYVYEIYSATYIVKDVMQNSFKVCMLGKCTNVLLVNCCVACEA